MTLKRKLLLVPVVLLVLLFLLLSGFIAWFLLAGEEVLASYSAKILASGVFVAERTPESVASMELAPIPFVKYAVDREAKTVTAWTVGRHRKTAVYREGLGVALAHDGDVEALRRQARPDLLPDRERLAQLPWPMGDAPSSNPHPEGIDEDRLRDAVDVMFNPPSRFLKRHTRAIVVVYKDEIIAERYADSFTSDQRFAGWSMTKSVFHALYGIAVRQGKVSLQDRLPFWQEPDDPRSEITVDMLLRMSSGLDYTEFDVLPPTPQTTMLFLRPGAGAYAATLPLLHAPDTHWAYASASTNILSLYLRQAYGEDAYYNLPYTELFSKIGMGSAILEADASGTFVGSSFMHATARDYARFGLLYLHDGIWQGERILPEGWVDYGRTPTPTAGGRHYGAHWWLADLTGGPSQTEDGTPLPADTLVASGFECQQILVIPSREVVIVLLNLDLIEFSPHTFAREVLAALPK